MIMQIKDVRSIVECERDLWKCRADDGKRRIHEGNYSAISQFYDAMAKWEVLSDLIFKIDMYEIEKKKVID